MADGAGDDEDESDTAVHASTKPATNQLDASARSHEGDEDELSDRTNQEGRNRRGRGFDALRKAEDAALFFIRDDRLNEGLFGGFDEGGECHPNEHPNSKQDD